jgi:hypothetical protein
LVNLYFTNDALLPSVSLPAGMNSLSTLSRSGAGFTCASPSVTAPQNYSGVCS